ncbi:hypothetical protein F7725_013101, partial [Dissostichus mawsoni]
MACKQLNEWLEVGKALADENQRKERKDQMFPGGIGTWMGNFYPNIQERIDLLSGVPEVEESQTHEIPLQVPSLDQHLQTMRNLLGSLTVPASSEETPTVSTWTQRQLKREQKFRAAMPELLNLKLAAEIVTKRSCLQCKTADAVVRCLDCVPPGIPFLCPACDRIIHGKNVFHDREAMIDGFYRPIPPTSLVVVDESGQYGLCEQVCLLPIPPPSQICFCGPSQDFTIIPGKQTVLVTINGLLPPEDDVTGRICSDTFHRVFWEFAFCNYRQEDLCLVEPFKCPACTPDMLAIAVDGNRKHYRFKKSRGTDEPSLFDGLIIAQDSKVSAFVDKIRSQMTTRADMITVLAMQWNHRKVENLHKTLAKRFVKTTQRAQTEVDNLESLKQELNISLEDTEQWVLEVKQWAATEKHGAQSSQEELQREIDEMIYSLRRKKHELYRQN